MKKFRFLGLTIIYRLPRRYQAGDLFIGFGSHVYYRRFPDYVQRFKNLFLSYREEIDCDGATLTVTDKLTGGKIYHFYGWNWCRAGGGYGSESKWFDLTY